MSNIIRVDFKNKALLKNNEENINNENIINAKLNRGFGLHSLEPERVAKLMAFYKEFEKHKHELLKAFEEGK
jgi:hypothetical protein